MAKKSKSAAGDVQGGAKDQEEGFDARLARLEELVSDLEGGDLGLEAAMERFAEGVKLLAGCRDALSAYEERVEELSAEAESGMRELSAEDGDE